MHVITECTLIDLTPAASIFSQEASSISSFLFTNNSPLIGFLISSAADLPRTLSDKLTKLFP